MPSDRSGPHVVIIGGFLTEPFLYRPMSEHLLARGAERVTVAPVHLPDWGALVFGSLGPLALRGGRTILEARRLAPQPILVIGHSLGGIVARLAACDIGVDGRRAAVAEAVGCIVTLGTPHRLDPRVPWRHAAVKATDGLGRHCPGGCNTPRTAYLTVGSSYVRPAAAAPIRSPAQLAHRLLRGLVGETPGEGSDGLVDRERSRLAGGRHIELDDILHGVHYGPWYGDPAAIDRWWPAAVEAWREALAARATAGPTRAAGPPPAGPSPPAGSWPAAAGGPPR